MILGKGSTILFQGDSITDGGRSRTDDLNHCTGSGYVYLIAARLGLKHPQQNWRLVNRGVSGNRVVDLYARWKEDTLNLKPDVISVLVGVNDVGAEAGYGGGVSAERYARVYRMMLEDTKAALPSVSLVLCEPFALPVGGLIPDWASLQREITLRREVVEQLSSEFGATFVRLQGLFDDACSEAGPDYWLWDGVHPSPAGHEMIAEAWLAAAQVSAR